MKSILFLLIFFISIVQTQAAQGLLKNGGFEEGFKFWDRGGHADVTWDISTSVVRSGKKALHVKNASRFTSNIYGTISQTLRVTPNTKYEFSLWIKARNASHIWFVGGKGWSIRKPCPSGTYNWKHVVAYYKTKANEKTFSFRINFDGFAEDVWIDDIVVQENWIDDELTGSGEKAKTVNIEEDGACGEIGKLLKKYNDLSGELPTLRKKIYWYGWQKHIPMEYEAAQYEIIRRFLDSGRADISSGRIGRSEYVYNTISNMYQRASENADAYLKHKRTPPNFSRYITGKIAIEGKSFTADCEYYDTGKKERRNVIFVGYGHFDQVRRDIPIFHKLGCNIIQVEIGPNRGIIVPSNKAREEFAVNTRAIETDIIPVLKNAEANNIAVSILISPHYFPGFILDKYPEMKLRNGFIPYDIYHPLAKKVLEAYVKALIPMVKDFKSLQNICISNEPHFSKPGGVVYKKFWHTYLEHQYNGKIESLNWMCKTDYADFESVPVANIKDEAGVAAYYDWVIFNSQIFADWHKWLAGIVRELAPDVPLNAKFRVHCTYDPLLTREGVDPELFADIFDINGCDSSCYWNMAGILPSYLNEMAAYDMLTSFKNAPVFNSENHIINDGDKGNYAGGRALHTRMVLWQGAIHGCSATTIWLWERGTYELFAYRPDCMEAVSTTALDLNRLSGEVTALQNITPHVAILYALPAFVHSLGEYKQMLKSAYKAFSLSGVPVAFISEKQIAAGSADKYKIIVVPHTEAIHPATLLKLSEFAENGGKVMLVTDNRDKCLVADEHKNALTGKTLQWRADLLVDARISASEPESELRAVAVKLAKACGVMESELIDNKTGEIVEGVEWRQTIYDGKIVWNIANYTMMPKTVKLMYKGKPIDKVRNLLNNKINAGDKIVIPALTPLLLTGEKF